MAGIPKDIGGQNCQTYVSYVIFLVESTGVISFLVTRSYKQIV